MARPDIDFSKYFEVAKLNTGDIIQLTTGEKVTFIKCKQKNFVGTMEDGKNYSIFINKFDKILETAKQISKDDLPELFKTLTKGDLFYINHRGNAMLFVFETFKNNRIVGINPISNGTSNIDVSLYAGKVSGIGAK